MMARMNSRDLIILLAALLLTAAAACSWRKTKVLVVNPLPAQASELMVNNTDGALDITCTPMDKASGFAGYDIVVMYGRGLFLDSLQTAELQKAAAQGVKIFTSTSRNSGLAPRHNLPPEVCDTLQLYFSNPCRANYVNLLRYLRHIAGHSSGYGAPVKLPTDMLYHLADGKYFKTPEELTAYLRKARLYNPGGRKVAFISGLTFPVEGNRAHVDSLISKLTAAGYNVYPISAKGDERARLLRETEPDAVVYLPMGRLGNDSLINWCYDRQIPLFMPFPLVETREEWLDAERPVSGGTLNARVVVPEIDGAMAPLCISTQNAGREGYVSHTPEPERIDAFVEQLDRFMRLRDMANADKKVAIAYFKSPGKDALLASGMEVIPSLYNFLLTLKRAGYNVAGLPGSLEGFRKEIMRRGSVMGDYASNAQKEFMEKGSPLWIRRDVYEKWASEVLLPEKYREIVKRYGKAPGRQLSRGDSIAVAAIRYGNVLLFPQPRPALGDDEFRLAHGAKVAPPHSYVAPYLYMQKGFDADILIHFGTHGSLEFTPGKNAGLSQADWADALTGRRPHFYFYTTGNVGEAIIAKRRTHAVTVTHLTPPFVESGLRSRYSALLDDIHAAIADSARNTYALKKSVIDLGIHRDLRLDSLSRAPYTREELETIDGFVEELAAEKITGAFYTLGVPYSGADMQATLVAIAADKIAYQRARRDREAGKITATQLHDATFVRHHYYKDARHTVELAAKGIITDEDGRMVEEYHRQLLHSPEAELRTMLGAMSGIPVRPAPGGDPVLNPNVLPTGRNMYSINVEATPDTKAWSDGVALAEQTLADYKAKHGKYPEKVSFTFWAGEFIASKGATLAQALRMLGVEPVRDEQGRVMDLRLTPSAELGRPRVNVMVQVSGQLRDIAGSRLSLLTEAVRLASAAEGDLYPNYVAEGTGEQRKALEEAGMKPEQARRLSTMRVFGPVNSGYSTGMLAYTENSGKWEKRKELADGFVNNMCAMYGDSASWGVPSPAAMKAAVSGTGVIVQPRQSNTWGPVSLDHVYEFTGALSLLTTQLDGKEPEAVMADYRNSYTPRMQNTEQAVAVETRATLLNPVFIRERMKGGATTAERFGEMFRNVFGWTVTRPSALTEGIYDDLYDTYIADVNDLGIRDYFDRENPAAFQEMTATMLESARKGYWQPSDERLREVAEAHADMTERHGAPCTEFVCGNDKLQRFTAMRLPADKAVKYRREMEKALESRDDFARPDGETTPRHRGRAEAARHATAVSLAALAALAAVITAYLVWAKRKKKHNRNEE